MFLSAKWETRGLSHSVYGVDKMGQSVVASTGHGACPTVAAVFLMSLNTPILQNETGTLPEVTELGMAESKPELSSSNSYLFHFFTESYC